MSRFLEYFISPFRKNPNEVQALNGFRAFAILFVILIHLFQGIKFRYPDMSHWILNLFDNLISTIDLFFIISGLLIYQPIKERLDQNKSFSAKTFAINRFFRIVPCYYLVLGISYLLAKTYVVQLKQQPNLSPENLVTITEVSERLRAVWADLFFVSNYRLGIFDVGWSLSLEVQFYVLLPFMVFLVLKHCNQQKRTLFLLGFYLLILLNLIVVYSFSLGGDLLLHETHLRFDSILAGMILAEILDYDTNSKQGYFLLLLGISFLALSHFLEFDSTFRKIFGTNLNNIGFGCFVFLGCKKTHFLNKIFSSSFFRPWAKISYSIYLWNVVPLGIVFGQLIKPNVNLDFWLLCKLVFFSYLVTFLFCYIFYLLVEAPSLKLRNFFVQKSKA